jgi:hypothetical protein
LRREFTAAHEPDGLSATLFWTLVLQVGGLAEAQRFSILRTILSMLILMVPTLLLLASF